MLVAPRVLIACAFAIVLAAYVGFRLGRALAADLVVAAEQVRSLGREDVLRGGARVPPTSIITENSSAIDDLTERFRVFAAAQTRDRRAPGRPCGCAGSCSPASATV